MQRVFDARLFLFHFDFRRRTDLDQRYAASQLGHTLLQLLTVVVAGGFFDLRADRLDAGFDVLGIAGTVDQRGVFFGDFDALGLAEVGQSGLFRESCRFLQRSRCRR